MSDILNNILKGLFEWLYGLFLDLIAYCANALLGVMGTDLTYFETSVPVIKTMFDVFVAVGWALLIGNCVFQAMKSMLSGLGFEAESPATLFSRTFVFSFLLLVSRQVCEIGLSISSKVITLLGVPTHVELKTPDSNFFDAGGATWVLVIIIGVILGIQLIKLFFEIGERYVVVAVLTFMSPMAFAMGGSKATKEIFTGYIRMYASMLLMMIMNVAFLKMILSALAAMPSGLMVLPWCVLVVALAKVARKVDNLISRIGLNPAITGDPLGKTGMATFMAARMIMNSVSKSKMGAKGGAKPTGSSTRTTTSSYGGGSYSRNNSSSGGSTFGGANTNAGGSFSSANAQNSSGINSNTQQNQNSQANQNSRFGGSNSASNAQSAQSTRTGSNVQTNSSQTGRFSQDGGSGGTSSNVNFSSGTSVNHSRFGSSGALSPAKSQNQSGGKGTTKPSPSVNTSASQAKSAKVGTGIQTNVNKKTPGVNPNVAKGKTVPAVNNMKKGNVQNNAKSSANKPGTIKQNANSFGKVSAKPTGMHTTLKSNSTAPQSIPANTDTAQTAEPISQAPEPTSNGDGNE